MRAWEATEARVRRFALIAAIAAIPVGLPGAGGAQTSDAASETAFRVCADPSNLPFSNEAGEGFENKLAELFAAELGVPLQYTWYPQATGFIRKTLAEAKCDVVMGYAQGHELVLNTNHYMTSAYALVTRPDSPLADVDTLSDPALQDKVIGVIAGSPPATHMARHGLIGKARPYRLMVDTRYESPARDMVEDVRSGEIDGAVVWGPIGGYYAARGEPPLEVQLLLDEELPPKMFYRITMGVRQGELAWKRKLNSLIRRNQERIDDILTDYGVPLVTDMGEERER